MSRLDLLQPYPFERLARLKAGVTPPAGLRHVAMAIGEPQHAAPPFVLEALRANLHKVGSYPATIGLPELRGACARWLERRFGLGDGAVDAASMVLPVNGTREALFAFAQAMVDPQAEAAPTVVMPNPFYQIYEGAALLAGAEPVFAPATARTAWLPDLDAVPEAAWRRCQLLYLCSPGNPTGAVMPLAEWARLFELSDRHGFVIASDECYSEIYFRDEAPLGGLEAALQLGRSDFKNLLMFTSLSKRSNVPGLRSGFVAGDAALIKPFLLYRTYHGGAMSPAVQAASVAAWNDEAHVLDNRRQYREKFAQVMPVLSPVLDVALPDAAFYLWAGVPAGFEGRVAGLSADEAFARELLAQYNVTVLPGSYLAREVGGVNPGKGRVRMALVAETAECLEAAGRIQAFVQNQT